MAWLRAYVDKKITSKGGGDHSRIIDFEVPDDGFRFLLPENGGPVEVSDSKNLPKLKKDEQIGQVVRLYEPGQNVAASLTLDSRKVIVDSIAGDLAASLGIGQDEARQLAEGAVAKADL
jgi:hypothetical protein